MLENCEIIVERDVNIDGCDKVAVFSDLVTANQLYKIIIINYKKKIKKKLDLPCDLIEPISYLIYTPSFVTWSQSNLCDVNY